MIKLVYCLRKRDDVSQRISSIAIGFPSMARWSSLWHRRSAPAATYKVTPSLPELNELMLKSRGLQAPYDGITEVWWEDQAALERGMASPEGIVAQAQLIEDESRFIDFSQSSIFMTEEHTIF